MVKEKSGLGPSASLYDTARYIPNTVKLEVDLSSFFKSFNFQQICGKCDYWLYMSIGIDVLVVHFKRLRLHPAGTSNDSDKNESIKEF